MVLTPFTVKIGEWFSLGGDRSIQDAGEDYTIFSILSTIIKNLYVLVGVVLLFMLFVGGLGMILNAGNAEAQKKSNHTLTSALIGFAVLIAAYWLVRIIEIIFGLSIFSPQ